MKNKSYNQLSIIKVLMLYIKLRGYVECESLVNDSHIAELEIVKEQISKRGYQIVERGKQVEFVRV